MQINTAFSQKDKVFLMDNNKVSIGVVDEIDIHVSIGAFKHEEYTVTMNHVPKKYKPELLFNDKESLLKSL